MGYREYVCVEWHSVTLYTFRIYWYIVLKWPTKRFLCQDYLLSHTVQNKVKTAEESWDIQ